MTPTPAGPAPIVVDGTDDAEGRGLFVLSALHLASGSLAGVPIRLLCPAEAVRTAAEVLRWDTGLHLDLLSRAVLVEADLAGAALYVAVVGRSMAWLPLSLVAAMGVRSLVAVQFPPPGCGADQALLARAAHDPRAFGARIAAALGRPTPTVNRP